MSVPVPPRLLRTVLDPIMRFACPPGDWATQRKRTELVALTLRVPGGVRSEQAELGGRPALKFVPKDGGAGRVVLYLHGGGYCVGSPTTHRAIPGRLAKALDAVVYSLDYRLVPEHPFPAAAEDTMRAYRDLLDGTDAADIAVAGDSAGAGLAIGLTVAARYAGWPLPGALGLICPAVDFSDASSAWTTDDAKEAILKRALYRSFADDYAPENAADPAVSQLYADLTGLPPIVIDAAEHDILRGDGLRLRDKAIAAGVQVVYRERADLFHTFHTLAGTVRQADEALDEVAASLAAAMDVNRPSTSPDR